MKIPETGRDGDSEPMDRQPPIHNPYDDLESILLTEERIRDRILEMGREISRDYAGKEIFMMSVLKGSVIFLADITRAVSVPVEFGFMTISTYGEGTRPQNEPSVTNRTFPSLKGKHVLLVEDILDTGATIAFARRWVLSEGAAGVGACVLLAKEGYRDSLFPNPDYVGFAIPNVFVVGYGLDYAERYRNLRCVGVLKPSIYSRIEKRGEEEE